MKVRLDAYRLLAYICQVLTGIVKDVEMDKIENELQMLEKAIGE